MMTIFDSRINTDNITNSEFQKACRQHIQNTSQIVWSKTENGFSGRVNTIGIEKVSVTLEGCTLLIVGENKLDGQSYKTENRISVPKNIMDSVIEVKYKTVAGVTIFDLVIVKPEVKRVKVTAI